MPTVNTVWELGFRSDRSYADPFAEVELDVLFRDPAGVERRVPAFWAGDDGWRVRYSSPLPGTHTWLSHCSDTTNAGLHGREGVIELTHYAGDNPLRRHGGIAVSADRRTFTHADGTPFFWLGDTWWMGLCERIRWPQDFRLLIADRVAKGFSVIQIVAGLYPDMPAYDPRGRNEAGYPWAADWARINPRYFDLADLRLEALVDAGLTPCIVGCWGYYLPWLGVERMKRHWRYLVARWAALPVAWCLAGEGAMPWYLTDDRERDVAQQKAGWTELARYVRAIDPFDRPVGIHPTSAGREQVDDPALLDFEMLQTGHGDRGSLPNTIRVVAEAIPREPRMPVVNSEVCYEGIGEACRQEVIRLMFWASILGGCKGFTYGANGLWQANGRTMPYGPSPHGLAWGSTPWEEAMHLPGSSHLAAAKRILAGYDWTRIEPQPSWVAPHATPEQPGGAFAAGIPGELRLVYLQAGAAWGPPPMRELEPGLAYSARLVSPIDGEVHWRGAAQADADGQWRLPFERLPIFQDWLLILSRGDA